MQEAAFRRERLPTVEELIDFLENRDIVGTLEFVGELIQ